MKPIVAILALITITFQVMAGGVSSVVVCRHIDGDSHSIKAEIPKDLDDCCDHSIAPISEDCDACVDTEIESDGYVKVPSTSERNLLKSPLSQAVEALFFEEILPRKPSQITSQRLSRAPPLIGREIAPHIKITVLRV